MEAATLQEERLLLKKDTTKQNSINSAARAFAPVIGELMQAWKALDLGEVTLDTLAQNRDKYELFVKTLLYEANEAMKSLPIDRTAAIKMMNLPDGFKAFASAMENYSDALKRFEYYHALALDDAYWHIDEQGHCTTSDAYAAYLERATCVYATEKQIEIANKAKEAIDLLNELQAMIGNDNIRLIPANSLSALIQRELVPNNYSYTAGAIILNNEVLQQIK